MPTGHASLMPALRRVVLAGSTSDRTDGQLLGAFVADRDADAFAQLVRRHGPMVLGVCSRVIGHHATAEDAFQAVFLVLARRAAAVRPREQVGNWLYGVAYRTALKARAVLARRRSREKQVEVMPEPPGRIAGAAAPAAGEWADLQPIIDEELDRLPEKLRAPVVLCDIEGRAQRDVAKQLGVPAATLATRLASARRTLAQRLSRRGVTLSGGAVAALLTAHATAAAVPHAAVFTLARAAESLAAGGAASGLVPAHAVQLSEGVMRMMLLSKLKAVAVVALTAATLAGGLGLGLVPARAGGPGDDPAPATAARPAPAAPPVIPPADTFEKAAPKPADVLDRLIEWKFEANAAKLTDAEFLRRLVLDVRGDEATDIETYFFVADEDDNKRAKLVEWLVEDVDVKGHAAKRLGVPAERIHLAQLVAGKDGKPGTIVVVVDAEDKKPEVKALAFSPDGKQVTVTVIGQKVDAVSPDGKRVAVTVTAADEVVTERRVKVVRTENGKTVVLEEVQAAQPGPKATPGKRVVVVEDKPAAPWYVPPGMPGRVQVWDLADGDKSKLWGTADGKKLGRWVDGEKLSAAPDQSDMLWDVAAPESDLDFLKRITAAARGTAPTALEEKYFTEDRDPKKREKLIDTLLKEPAVAKKLGDDFKRRMLAGPGAGVARVQELKLLRTPVLNGQNFEFKVVPFDPKGGQWDFKFDPKDFKLDPKDFKFEFKLDPKDLKLDPKAGPFRLEIEIGPDGKPVVKPAVVPPPAVAPRPKVPNPPQPPQPPAVKLPVPATPAVPAAPKAPVAPATPAGDKVGKLIDDLLAGKKSDAEILEAITLATATRLPTETEKRLTLGLVGKAADRKAAWVEVAKALAADEAPKGGVRFRAEIVPPGR